MTVEPRPTILIADDQLDVLEALRLMFKAEGFQTETARSVAAILAMVETRELDAVIMDLNYTRDTTSGREGLDLIPKIAALEPNLPIIVMTAWGSVDAAVEAIRNGAWDFIEKPWDNARLMTTLRTQLELGRAVRRAQRLEGENRLLRKSGLPEIIAESPRMRPILQLMERVGPSDAHVLITGEHGTGKELVARWLHAVSPRSSQAFVAVNMGGLSEGVFESELFGHVRGAFTDAKTDRVGRFELADRGTLFLDEIANIPHSMQAKLLRVLQSGEVERVGSSRPRAVNTRILSATNADLHTEVAEGRFREDLLFRLNTIEICLPPLRDRREDIPLLATHFLKRHSQRYGKQIGGFDSAGMQALLDHIWPGNIRELDHAVERAVLLAQGEMVRAGDLALRGGTPTSNAASRFEELTLEEAERLLIQKALTRFDGNVSQAAKALGLSRSALYRRLSSHGL
ncbi:MAG TPA: sigma-54 dependent transcriptional regulator [Gemmatimonadaceae bacterium]|nr:sigma-54 dependent transcriptional regulator [Gemmatimonadaceae bacterium]